MGELSAETLKLRGIKGYVVDGGCRDTAFIRRIGFPVVVLLHDSSRHCRYLDTQKPSASRSRS
jgi:regulator of RNase E activity RraA